MRRSALRTGCWLVGLTLAAGSSLTGAETQMPDPGRPAYLARLAAKAPLTDVTRAGNRLVGVGDFGIVLLSDDAGRSWRQARAVPVRSMLTAVTFANEQRGWAVGHGGIVIATADGGENWSLVHSAGVEVSLLSVWFADANRGIAVGAFGYAMGTADAGRTWTRITIGAGDDADRHLNRVFPGPGESLFIAAETGTVFVSGDRGKSWATSRLPYNGSMWGGMATRDGTILVWGMRGHVLSSVDLGRTWNDVPTGTDQSFSGGTPLADGTIVLAGLGGALAVSGDGGRHFRSSIRPDRGNYTAVIGAGGSDLVLVGGAGVLAASSADVPSN